MSHEPAFFYIHPGGGGRKKGKGFLTPVDQWRERNGGPRSSFSSATEKGEGRRATWWSCRDRRNDGGYRPYPSFPPSLSRKKKGEKKGRGGKEGTMCRLTYVTQKKAALLDPPSDLPTGGRGRSPFLHLAHQNRRPPSSIFRT